MKIVSTAAPATPITHSLMAPLCSLLSTISAPKAHHNWINFRSRLLALDSEVALRSHLTKLADGPPRATVLDFAFHLTKLASHYWQRNFTAEQAKYLFSDFATDLADLSVDELEAACRAWRNDPREKFFPQPGALREKVKDTIGDRVRIEAAARFALEALDRSGADDAPVVDIRTRFKDFGTSMQVNAAAKATARAPLPQSTMKSTARDHTDAAELLAALEVRT